MFIDSHAHLEMKEFDSDRDAVLQRAADAGIDFIVTVGTNLSLSRKALELARQYENVFATVGVHPHDVERINNRTLDDLKKLASDHKEKIVAYGEIGLDFFRNLSLPEKQMDAFSHQLQLAKELHLPVVIHDREAHEQILAILRESGIRQGVFHCFSGDYEMAKKCLDLGFYLSVPGVVTFQYAQILQDVVRRVPLASLILETDAPYLAPIPHRGKRNEPSFMVHTAQKVAEVKNVPLDELARQTSENTVNLFKIKKPSVH
jgi:TatD DNase family protein